MMKTKFYFLPVAFFCLAIILFACNSKSENNENNEANEAYDALGFLSTINAFPNNDIPADAYGKAYDYYKAHFKNNNTKNATSFLPWNSMGPNNVGGRTVSIAIDPVDTNVVWLGSASGGLWKSVTGGIGANAWQSVETGFPVLGVSAIAINPQNHNEMYIGTGETYSYGTAVNGLLIRTTRGSHGIGILKSTDGGITWTHTLNWLYQQQRGVWKVVYNYQNPATVIAATTDGIYKTTDAGVTWLQTDTNKMVMDMVMDPVDTNIMYAGVGNLGTANGGLYRSSNGGDTWTKITNGLPANNTGRITVSVYAGNPNYVYANIANDLNSVGFYVSTDKGLSWTVLNSDDISSYQGWYSKGVFVDPADNNNIFVCGVYLWQSIDGGNQFTQITDYDPYDVENKPWPDMHDLISNPLDAQKLYLLTDAGLYRSDNSGGSWKSCLDGYVVAQFYLGSLSASNNNIAIGGLQDRGTQRYNGTNNWDWVLGGDGTCNAIDRNNDAYQYASYQNLNVQSSDDQGFTFPYTALAGNGAFVSPFELAISNQDVMYGGSNVLYQSIDKGVTWNAYGPYGATKIMCIGVSPTNELKLYFASAPDDTSPMQFFVSTDGGATVTDISAGLPNRYPRDVAVNANNDNEAVAVFSGFGTGHVFQTIDGGQTWNNISTTLPDVPVHSVLYFSSLYTVIIIGTDLGVFYSNDNGLTWNHAGTGLPDAIMVFDLEYSIADQTVVAFTHGRGAYKTPFSQFYPSAISEQQIFNSINIYYSAPANNLILQSESVMDGTLEIYNNNGANVYNSKIKSDRYFAIDMQSWKNGLYVVQFINGNYRYVKKVVKI